MKKTISLVGIISLIILGSCLLVMGSYLLFEPEEARSSVTATSSVDVTLAVTEEVTITPPSTIAMSPSITATLNSSIGGTSTIPNGPWIVKTNAVAGYTLTLYATSTPALKHTATSTYFNDAATSSPVTWGFSGGQSCVVASTTCFGFSVFGTDVATTTWGTDTNCGSGGTPSSNLKYRGFESTTSTLVASRVGVTPVAGIGTTMCVAAAQNSVYAASGNYKAVIIGTATTQ